MSVRLGVLADLHAPRDHLEPAASWHGPFDFAGLCVRVRAALSWFAQERCNALVLLGDLAQHGDLATLREVAAVLRRGWGGPLVAVAGNHDGLERDDQLVRAFPTEAADALGAAGLSHRFGVRSGHAALVGQGGGWSGELSDPGAVLLLSHFPLINRARKPAARELVYAGDLANREELLRSVVDGGRPCVVLCAHLHVRDSAVAGSVLQLGQASMIERPCEAMIVELDWSAGEVCVARRCRALDDGACSTERWHHSGGRGWKLGLELHDVSFSLSK